MSRPMIETITCPNCGRKSEFTMWSSINVTLDPELKQKLLKGQLFKFTCPECGYKADVQYEMLYHDMDKKFMIQMGREGGEEEFLRFYDFQTKNAPDCLAESLKDSLQRMREKYLLRYVTSINELMEKVEIFDAGLDDRIVEMVKAFTIAGFSQRHPDIEVQGLYYQPTDDGAVFVMIANGHAGTLSFSDELYKMNEELMQPLLTDIRDTGNLVVDRYWAKNFMEVMNNNKKS